MESSSPDSMVRQNLLDRLLNSVKQVQVHFGARQEIATESDARVSALCTEWEMVLTHGAKKPKPKNALRLTGRSEGVSLWPLAKLCVSIEDLQRFSRLNHVTTELGRGRAWLRASINERTLEIYMHTALAHEEQLRRLYEPHAFLVDQERSSMLPIMAAGLTSIIFSIPTDAVYLNNPARSVEVPALPSQTVSQPPVINSHSVEPVQPHFHSYQAFLLPTTSTPELFSQQESLKTERTPNSTISTHTRNDGTNPFPSNEDDDVVAVSAKVKKKKHKKSKTSVGGSVVPGSEITHPVVENNMLSPVHSTEERPLVPLKESTSSSSSRLSLDSTNEERQAPICVALTTSNDVASSEAMAAANATALVLSATSVPLEEQFSVGSNEVTSVADGEQFPDITTQQLLPSTKQEDNDIRTAMLSLSKMKDDLEYRNKELTETVSNLETHCQELNEELKECKQELCGMREAHSGQRVALERENDLLREQLKKYIGIVQAQRRETPVQTSESQSSNISEGDGTESVSQPLDEVRFKPEGGKTIDQIPSQDSMADQKLQEMAEMYGELMELNERLHRNLADKDLTICTLVCSLREANIEVPVPMQQLPPNATAETRGLVDVWIPSAIKKGRGPDGFHVYQVFVCVKSVEWNIYRRYAEFREFHRQLQKYLPMVADFNFPPKKALHNKSSHVVEDRRLRLQQYLRLVFKACSSHCVKRGRSDKQKSEPIISSSITKEILVTMFPFFKEDFNIDPPPTTQVPSYSGL